MNLDTSNPVTQGHMRGVLLGLIQKLKTYITANPNDKTTRSLRMLQMASESLLKWWTDAVWKDFSNFIYDFRTFQIEILRVSNEFTCRKNRRVLVNHSVFSKDYLWHHNQ